MPAEEPTIQAGISAAGVGDTVLVECGRYYEHDIVMRSGVVLRSEGGSADCVTIDAQRLGRILHCGNVTSSTRIEGFSIVNGSGDFGGGLECFGNPVLINCSFSGNSGLLGGALYALSGFVTLESCGFIGNDADGGGAICCESATVDLRNCFLSGNTAAGLGGAVLATTTTGTPRASIITQVMLSNSTVARNTAGQGGAIACSNFSHVSSNHCTFYGNEAKEGCGVYLQESSTSELDNTIVAFGLTGEAVHCGPGGSSTATLVCSDIYGNAGGDWIGCIAGQSGSEGNLSQDPQFCNAQGNDFRIREDSPCAPEHSPSGCGLIGALPVGCTSTGVAEVVRVRKLRLSVQPHPVHHTAEFVLDAAQDPVALEIYDPAGRLVEILNPGVNRSLKWRPSENFRPGVYFARLRGQTGTAVTKFVLLH